MYTCLAQQLLNQVFLAALIVDFVACQMYAYRMEANDKAMNPLFANQSIWKSTEASYGRCLATCKSVQTCVTGHYVAATAQCTFYDFAAHQVDLQAATGNFVFYKEEMNGACSGLTLASVDTAVPGLILPSGLTSGQNELISNSLSIDCVSPDLFTSYPTVNRLVLDQNNIKRLPSRLFTTLTNLTSFVSRWSQLSSLPPTLFQDKTTITQINIANNYVIYVLITYIKFKKIFSNFFHIFTYGTDFFVASRNATWIIGFKWFKYEKQ